MPKVMDSTTMRTTELKMMKTSGDYQLPTVRTPKVERKEASSLCFDVPNLTLSELESRETVWFYGSFQRKC